MSTEVEVATTGVKVELPKAYEDIKDLIRTDRLPHIWCPGCGLGILLKLLARAIKNSGIPIEKHVIVTGIGCTGRLGGYLKLDAYHVTHGRAIPFAVGLKMANPELEVTVVGGDGDILAIGGNHFIHAARRNDDINVIIVNNFIYGMTGGQYSPTTPKGAKTTTSPYGHFENPFNIPLLSYAAGASYVARWSVLHQNELYQSLLDMFKVKGFAVIEVLSPCIIYTDRNAMGDAVDLMKVIKERSTIDHNANLADIDIDFSMKKIVLGNFAKRERPISYG